MTSACLGIVSCGVTGHAQVTQNNKVVVAPQASVASDNFMETVDFARFTLRTVKGGTLALRLSVPLDRLSQASRSNPSKAHTRSKKRILAGAIAGGTHYLPATSLDKVFNAPVTFARRQVAGASPTSFMMARLKAASDS